MKASFYVENRRKLSNLLSNNSVAIIHSSAEVRRTGDQLFPYRQHSDILYLTGITQPETWLILCPSHPEISLREALFVKPINAHDLLWNGTLLSTDEAAAQSGVSACYPNTSLNDFLKNLPEGCQHVYLNISEKEIETLSQSELSNDFLSELDSIFPQAEKCSLSEKLASLRVQKSEYELDQIARACRITHNAFLKAISAIKNGNYEYQVRAELVGEFLKNGAVGESFHTIAASGANACVLHYSDNNTILKDGNLLLIDFGVELPSGYASDVTRTLPIGGRFTARQRQLYEATLRVYKRAERLYVQGNTIANINAEVGKFWEDEHIALGLYTQHEADAAPTETPLYKQYYPHGTSHFLGLDVHDVGSREEVLRPGMVLTCEPGIYIREEGIGIRLENDILITEQAPHNLTADIPIEIADIEKLFP